MGSLEWAYWPTQKFFISDIISDRIDTGNDIFCNGLQNTSMDTLYNDLTVDKRISGQMAYIGTASHKKIVVRDLAYTSVASFKSAMSGKYLYYQRLTDSSWTAPTVTYIYANAPLRKVSNYADVLNSNGTITRNVGVKVLNGTESWAVEQVGKTGNTTYRYVLYLSDSASAVNDSRLYIMSTHYPTNYNAYSSILGNGTCRFNNSLFIQDSQYSVSSDLSGFKSYLAQQYAAGTPVTVYYPLATPTTENITLPSISMNNGDNIVTIGTSVAPSGTNVWPASLSCILASAGIKIATTKYVATAFADSASELNATMGTIKNVVDNTIIQADRIGKLHTGKQNRPAENCPDGAQCLLITEADGSLHWYPICNADGTVGTQSGN